MIIRSVLRIADTVMPENIYFDQGTHLYNGFDEIQFIKGTYKN